MRTLALLVLVTALLSVGTGKRHINWNDESKDYSFGRRTSADAELKPFQQKDTEYSFIYNAQIASGLHSEEDSAVNPQQKAMTRIQCVANIQFASERHAQLQLQQCRVGQQNEQISEPQEVQPMGAFEQTNIPEQTMQQLQKPCQFSYADGVIERVQCQSDGEDWSKNFKKAVLNMIQMNLKRNNAQGLHRSQVRDEQQQVQQQQQDAEQGITFNIPEITLEGACQTTYTINKARRSGQQQYNVTKTINFKKCQKIADVANGFQTDQPQAQCEQCHQYWAQQQGDQQNIQTGAATEQQSGEEHPCAKCDPKEVKENELDRSTVIRCQIQGEPSEQYTLKGCELRSQYVYRNSKSADGSYGAAMQTVVAATLKALDVKPKKQQIPALSSTEDETLMHSNEKEVDEKRFFMNGDKDFNSKGSPFARVPKVQQAKQALLKLEQSMQDKHKGIDQQAPVQQQRLVEMLRMCTQQELKQVEQQQCSSKATAQQAEQCKQIVANALAQCGTLNCVTELAKKIKTKQVSKANAVQALLALNQLPAPSDSILDEMEQLCQSEAVQNNQMIKQSCWLTFGALVNELCQHKAEKNAQECVGNTANCVQSGFFKKGQCPMDKKQKYKEAMLAVYQNQENCIYDKAVALGALGNAGLDIALTDLEQIIKDPRESRVVRVIAVDATRRLRTKLPQRVQNVLLPVFLNTREQPQVRIAAFANVMDAQPAQQVIDQLMFAITKEPNKEVQSYAFRTMQTVAKSQKPSESQIAKHIKSALKMANVDEQQLRASGLWQFGAICAEQREGVFVSLAQAVSPRSALPAYAHAQLDSDFNDQYQHSNIKVFMLQQEAEKWYGNMANRFFTKQQQQQPTRAERGKPQQQQNNQKLRNIYEALGIKSRRSDFGSTDVDSKEMETYQQNTRAFALLGLRSNNVDKLFLALDEHIMEEQTRRMLNGQEKANWAYLFGQQGQPLLNTVLVQNMNEKEAKIPTSAGVPLRILNSMPMLANIEGQLKIKADSANPASPLGVQFDINAKASARIAQIQKMEIIAPFATSGVECVRSMHVNLPLHGELNANTNHGISVKAKLPQQKTQLASAQSLPVTFIASVDPKSNLVREPRQILTVHDLKLERQQHDMNTVLGQKDWALPVHIRGHHYWPAVPSSYKQFAQLLMATENAVHVHYQPSQDSPRELTLRATGEQFQKAAQIEQPDTQLRNFYAEEFHNAYSCNAEQCQQTGECEQCNEFEQQQRQDAQEVESQQVRQQLLHNFINAYKPRQQYKHSIKLIAQTNGGAKDATAQCEIQAQCDERMSYCKLQTTVNANQKWSLNAQAHVVMPEPAASVQQLQQKPEQLKQDSPNSTSTCAFTARKHTLNRFANSSSSSNKQQQQQQQGKSLISAQQQRNFQRRSAFLNKFELEATYSLKAYAQNTINRALEMLKSTYFWNTKSQLLNGGQSVQKNGKIAAIIAIDPLTLKTANVTIRTPTQHMRMQQIELPAKVRPFSLVRQQSAQQLHSLAQLFQQYSFTKRPQCTVDGRSVNTFDNLVYTAPLSSSCLSVLAKDCGSEQPQFVVLMKIMRPEQQQQNAKKSAQNANKVLKVITADQQIECQPKTANQQQQQRLICKVNGQQVTEDEQCQDGQCVQFNDPQQTDVTIRAEGIAVRFNGRKAWLKVSEAFKNTQCGLCGHYDDSDDQEQELRMANGQIASGLAEFHRSYALQDSEQCTQQVLNKFYSEKNNNDGDDDDEQDTFRQQYNQLDDDNNEQYNNEAEENEQNRDWQKEQFDGKFGSLEQDDDEDINSDSFSWISDTSDQQCCCCCNNDGEDNDDDKQCKQNCQDNDQCQRKCEKQQCEQQQQQQQPAPPCRAGDDKCMKKCQNGEEAACTKEAGWPQWKTIVQEQNHAVCFSTEPVKQCPRGFSPYDSDYSSDDDEVEQQQQQQQQQNVKKSKKVSFVCMDRAGSETRRLLRTLRRGQRVVNVSARGASFTETVDEPQQCWRARN
uniref:Vitellogenin n=1 Tax=Globodera pallida TaxID=36090 RepID=A0A183C9B1_GLOPA